jgi:hypothetical protein
MAVLTSGSVVAMGETKEISESALAELCADITFSSGTRAQDIEEK